jgi:hypothetical protein
VSTGKKSERAVLHLNSCASFKLSMVDIDDECYPDWFAASTPKKSAAGRPFCVSVPRSIDSRMVPRSQTSIAKFTVPRLSKASQLKINSSIAMHYCMTGTSFARIEDPHLLKAFQLCRPDVKLPTRKELSSSLLNQCYDDFKKKIDSYLASSPYPCITSDGWSNTKNEPIINCMIVSPSVSLFLELIYTGEKSHNALFFRRYFPYSRKTLLIACCCGSHRQYLNQQGSMVSVEATLPWKILSRLCFTLSSPSRLRYFLCD